MDSSNMIEGSEEEEEHEEEAQTPNPSN